MIDGQAQVAFTLYSNVYPKIQPESYQEMMGVKDPIYFIDMGKERINKAAASLGLPPMAVEVPAGSFAKTQDVPVNVVAFSYWWGAGKEMSEDIAYEITKIAWQHAQKKDFANYHGAGAFLAPEMMPYGDWVVKDDIQKWYHPGALKFYREMKVPNL